MVKYDLEKKSYFLKDLEDGTGTFIKIAPKIVLRNNAVISFGQTHFAVLFPGKGAELLPTDLAAATVPAVPGAGPKDNKVPMQQVSKDNSNAAAGTVAGVEAAKPAADSSVKPSAEAAKPDAGDPTKSYHRAV